MLKNKFLVIAAFCFIGFSFAGDESQEESPSLTARAKTCLKSAANSPLAVAFVTLVGASLMQHVFDFSSNYIPGGEIVEEMIRKDNPH